MDNIYLILLIAALGLFIVIVVIALILLVSRIRKRELPEKGCCLAAAVSGIGRRSEQQDSYWISGLENAGQKTSFVQVHADDDCLAVVADGMGGMKNGGQISRLITDEMKEAFFYQHRPDEPLDFLQNALWRVNERVNAFLDEHDNGGSTMIAAYIRDQKLHYVSVGDSRICLVCRGNMKKLNVEHNFGNELDELARNGLISEEEARQSKQRAALTSYIGMGDISKVDGNSEPIPLEKGDCLLLMTDGVFGTLSDEEILKCTGEKDCRKIVVELGRMVEKHAKPKQDNYSAIAIQIL